MWLVDKESNKVVSLCKFKAVEYSFFRLMQTTLQQAIEKQEIESLEKVFPAYTRQHRALIKTVE